MLLEKQGRASVGWPAASADDDPAPSDPGPGRGKTPPRSALTALEQSVVALSLFDPVSVFAPPTAITRIIAWLFGGRTTNRLADDRLEALRRYCVLLRAGGATTPAEERNFLVAAGFSEAALHEIGRLIAVGRSRD